MQTPTTGLREAHAHIPAHGRALSMLNLASCSSSAECVEKLRGEADRLDAAHASGTEWVLAFGARVESWADRCWPTRAEMDAATVGRACAVMSFDHHAVVANTAALMRSGFTPASPDPMGGVIVRDPRSREPTGLMLESAAYAVWNAAPEPSLGARRGQVGAALADLAGLGFVEVHDLLSPEWLGPMLAEMDDRGELGVRVKLFAPVAQLERACGDARSWRRDRVELGGGKLFADGTLNSRTAWTLEPYLDPLPGMPCGKVMATREEIASALRTAEGCGLPLATHAIGDGAVRAVLDAVEEVGREREGKGSPRPRHRIEHAELIHPGDVPRFARLGVVASVQPCHLLTDIEALTRSLPDRLGRVLPLRSLIDDGCVPGDLLMFGSDTPIVRANPADSVLAATKRGRSSVSGGVGIAPEQSITEKECWAAFR